MGTEISEGQGRLIDKVISRGICVGCGACVGLCPYFNYFDGKVVVLDRCLADTWRCLQLCPRAGYEGTSLSTEKNNSVEESNIGTCRKVVMARAVDKEIREKAQYGGAVSSLIIYAFEKGYIRSAVLTDAGGILSPGGKLVKNRSELLDCSGSRYCSSGTLSALNQALRDGEKKIGVVGLPCQMEALARMGRMKPDGDEKIDRIALKIGLFCTWALDYRKLQTFLKNEGVDEVVEKYDIPPPPSEKFQVKTKKGWMDFPLSDIRPLVQAGCALCEDMTAEWADISIGTVEGREEWNMVIIRTDRGAKFVNEAVKEGRLEMEELSGKNLDHLKKAAINKRKRGIQAGIEMDRSQI